MRADHTGIATAFAGRYEIERELGHGGMATVYLARDVKHDRQVAVKVLRPELASTLAASRFLREVGISARLQHPHVLTLIDSGTVGDGSGSELLYYVMPYVEGESLRDRIARDGALPVDEATRLLREIADALGYAHRMEVVHRDIKPDNVLLSNGHALVVDFGIGKAIMAARGGRDRPERAESARDPSVDTLTSVGMSLGTPAYMAPEQVAGDPDVDHRADLYAVGVVAYEMLAGRPPFTGPLQAVLAAQVTATPPALAGVRPEVPAPLARVVERCLQKDRAARFQSAEELVRALDATAVAPSAPARARPWLVAAGVGLVAVVAIGLLLGRGRRERWARTEALPTLEQMTQRGQLDSAFVLAEAVERVLPGDSSLAALWGRISHRVRFASEPAGARVYRAPFDDTTRWVLVGTTPTDGVRVPSAVTRYRVEKEGYRPALLLAGGYVVAGRIPFGADYPRLVRLMPLGSADSGMVHVEGPVVGGGQTRLADFLIDRFETTNWQYKEFVDAGGYARRELWTEPFARDGRTLAWEQAVASFVDRTGRPGPVTWEGGAPPAGEEDLPVGGVSWYEAVAYARFRGKALPTTHHWGAAAGRSAAAQVVPGSTFNAEEPRRASTFLGMSPSGAFDMAGNLREWTVNDDGEGKRHIPGGGWTDPTYRFTNYFALTPFDRSPINGIRLAKYPATDPALAAATAPVRRPVRDYAAERPVSDAEFAAFLAQYDYDARPLDARIVSRDTTHPDWVVERVTYAAAYGDERVPATLYLPKRAPRPLQTLVFFPGSNAFYERSYDAYVVDLFHFLMRSGRALVVPEYRGMLGRIDPTRRIATGRTIEYRDLVVTWGKDVRRTVDYLVTRADVDTARLGYFGLSFGASVAPVMLAVEPRFKTAVLHAGGLYNTPLRPEVDQLHFLPRVRVPVLMLNGRYDNVFPTETSQRPFFRLLGTPAEHKRLLLYDEGHLPPRAQVITESLAWLDRYLGPVAR